MSFPFTFPSRNLNTSPSCKQLQSTSYSIYNLTEITPHHLQEYNSSPSDSPHKSNTFIPLYFSDSKKVIRSKSSIDWGEEVSHHLNPHHRKISSIISNCNIIQDDLVGTWKNASTAARSTRSSLINLNQEASNKNFKLLQNNYVYNEGKNKIKEKLSSINKRPDLVHKYDKVGSILKSPKKSEKINIPKVPEFKNSEHVFITPKDFYDLETARLLALNKRNFGNHFNDPIVAIPEKTQRKTNRMLNLHEINPEKTILTDIEKYRNSSVTVSPSPLPSYDKEVELKLDHEEVQQRLQSMNPLNRFIFTELKKMQPKNSNDINIRNRQLLEARISKDNNLLEKLSEEKRNKDAKPHLDTHAKQNIRQVKYKKKRQMSSDEVQIFEAIKIESDNIPLQRKLVRLVTDRQHHAFINKEI
ncbi:unnamed protein product [Blepharisma stoltei]|uniref:Uncharacterized protein n=1 Tax=Blepharisma stoltei TaxID=1481888 RepID=A0AAU9IA21_9CILI|nr:unnamed protein product [Blepharisma stoltei]